MTRLDNGETTCDMGAYEFVDPPDHDLALTNVPANITTNATSPQGAVVTYTAPTVVDEDSPLPSVNCSPASGSTFAIGTTTVTCTASDSDDSNSPVSQTFTVTVNDTDLSLTNLPANITVDATSPQGASVPYPSPTVVDEESPLPKVNCSPASGSVFPISTTKVTCTVSDSDDTPSSVNQTFTVTVKGAAAQVTDLINLVNSFGLPADFQASFDTQLQAVQADLAANNTTQACRDVTAFINHVKAQSGKGLTVSQANQLIAPAKQIQAVLGC
ncbi:MAG TPA: HYR domain-containing protein [Ktedonobacteraceae bacterium]